MRASMHLIVATLFGAAQASYVPEHDKIVHAPSTSPNSEGGDSISTGSQPRRLAVPQGGSAATYGSIVGFKVAGQKMQIHAFLGTNPVIKVGETDMEWKTVGVAFTGGTIESVEAEHGLTAVTKGTKAVSVGDLTGSGLVYPSGLAMVVTFTSDTNMDDVLLDFSSDDMAITTDNAATYPTVAFAQLAPNGIVATVVQDLKNEIYAFAPGQDITTVEIAVQPTQDLTAVVIDPLPGSPDKLSATISSGGDFFGLSYLDGSGTPIAQAVPVAACSEALDPDPFSDVTFVVIANSIEIDYMIMVVGAYFVDPCETCGFPFEYGSTINVEKCVLNGAGDACVTETDGETCYVSEPPPPVPPSSFCDCDDTAEVMPGACSYLPPLPFACKPPTSACEDYNGGGVCKAYGGQFECYSGGSACLPTVTPGQVFEGESCLADGGGGGAVGDPVATFQGVSTRYWLSMRHFTPVFEQGPFVVSQLAGPANPPPGLEAHKGAWVVATEVEVAGLDKLLIETVAPTALLARADNATAPSAAPPATDALTTIRLSFGGKPLAAGAHKLAVADATLAVSAKRVASEQRIGSGWVEQVDIKAEGLHLRVASSKANKFANEEHQVLGLHLDLDFLTFEESAVRGALPEIWGLQPMSEATKLLLDEKNVDN